MSKTSTLDASIPASVPPPADAASLPAEDRRESNQLIGMGLGLGAFGAVSALALGATCPLCVVAAPTMLGMGLYKRWSKRRSPEEEDV